MAAKRCIYNRILYQGTKCRVGNIANRFDFNGITLEATERGVKVEMSVKLCHDAENVEMTMIDIQVIHNILHN